MNTIPLTYEDAVKQLADFHAEDETIIEIWSFPDPAGRAVRFIEITSASLPPENGHVAPIVFGKDREFPFESHVALIDPSEWRLVQENKITLPEGWDRRSAQRIWSRS